MQNFETIDPKSAPITEKVEKGSKIISMHHCEILSGRKRIPDVNEGVVLDGRACQITEMKILRDDKSSVIYVIISGFITQTGPN